ncbi:MAG: molecular chaperone TorD family protein, partial [Chloroflexota bacterium]
MVFVLVSSNPLFSEMLSNTLLEAAGARAIQVAPDAAPQWIGAERPQLIVIDESRISAGELSEVLDVARSLPHSRTILLNLLNNDITIVSAQHATIGKVEDMVEAIRDIETDVDIGFGEETAAGNRAAAASARGGAYGFLALLCNQRPELALVRRLRAVGVEGFLGMVDASHAGDLVQQGLQEIAAFVAQTADLPDAEVQEQMAVDWTRLFRGVRPGYGPPPPYEAVYVEGDSLKTMQSVARVYRHYGVAPADAGAGGDNRPDYIGLELDFLRYACEQQAAAHEEGDEEAIERWMVAEEAFLQKHIG